MENRSFVISIRYLRSLIMDPITLGLPHRPPFIFVESVDKLEAGRLAQCSKTFRKSESFFEGHFPGNAIVPGVLLVEGMAQTAGIAVGGPDKMFLLAAIRSMKFLRPVRPEEPIGFSARKLEMSVDLFNVPSRLGLDSIWLRKAKLFSRRVCSLNHRHHELNSSIWGPFHILPTDEPGLCGSRETDLKNERNDLKVYPITELSMKKIAIVLCSGFADRVAAGIPRRRSWLSPKQGEQLPTLTLNYLGKQPELTGKPLLVEFWATWCPPCRKSIPHLNEIYSKYKAQGLQIVGITDEDEATVKKFQKQIPMDYNVAINTPGSIYEQFGIKAIPTAFLVDKGGKIVWTGHPMELSETEIQSVLN